MFLGFLAHSVEAALALKAMAKGPWPVGAARTNPKCWHEPLFHPDEAIFRYPRRA